MRFSGATGRIRTSGLPGRSRTLYPAELRSLIYEKRRYSVFQSCKEVNFQWWSIRGLTTVDHRVFCEHKSRCIEQKQAKSLPCRSCRSRTLYPAELRSLIYEKRRYSVFQSCKEVNFQWWSIRGLTTVDHRVFCEHKSRCIEQKQAKSLPCRSCRSRTLYPAELRSLIYEKRRYSVFQSCKVVNFQ